MSRGARTIAFESAPFGLSGTVYGTLLNHSSALAALGDRASAPPYNAPPSAPVLYVKPSNTLALCGDAVEIPAGVEELEVGACLGMVVGRTACRVTVARALDVVAGYLIVNDVSVPHENFYRPSIRFKARDGFCPLGPAVATRSTVRDPDALHLHTYVDGTLVQTLKMADMMRSSAKLLSDVTEFMTLSPGDVLAMGVARPSPRVRAGQRVDIVAAGLGTLSNSFVAAVS
jgi:5-oxopent-3-ene-1,2,5-tricarboxylate decarboxylase/2-hydroxyhepta-2,4-diene-1,7-dioate isomerase